VCRANLAKLLIPLFAIYIFDTNEIAPPDSPLYPMRLKRGVPQLSFLPFDGASAKRFNGYITV